MDNVVYAVFSRYFDDTLKSDVTELNAIYRNEEDAIKFKDFMIQNRPDYALNLEVWIEDRVVL